MSGLRRTLNLPQLVFYGIGTIVGAGIYSVIGAAAGRAGNGLLFAFALASVAALLTVLSYAELGAMYPRAGAEYQFLRHAFPRHRWPSFLAGWLIALNAAATSATVALAFAGYVQVFAELPRWIAALALLSACTAVNIAGIRQSTWLAVLLACIELGGLLLVIGLGLGAGEPGQALAWPAAETLPGVFAATALVFFMYIGFEDVANLAEESRDPERQLPRALLLSVALASVVYLLVAWAALALGTPQQLAASESPLADLARKAAPWAGAVLGGCALVATASTALISLVSVSRLLFGMGRDGDMPSPLSRTLGERRTPWVAALVLFAAAVALLPFGAVEIVASISACGVLVVFVVVQVAMIVLRLREPDRARPFRVRGSIGRVPVLPLAGIVACAALLTQFPPRVYAVVGGVLATGAVAHLLLARRNGQS